MFNSVKNVGNNPTALLNQMMNNNPKMANLQNQIKNSGMSPKEFLAQYMKQNNISQEQLNQMLKMFNIRF